MTKKELFQRILFFKSYLCVGLDLDTEKMPSKETVGKVIGKTITTNADWIFYTARAIIVATAPYCAAYKPNLAFFESQGIDGMKALYRIFHYLKMNYPLHFIIADAKRGDIGNTASHYAKAVFEQLKADAVTLAPYMGEDSVAPFLPYKDKWSIILALTSNKSSNDFEEGFQLEEGSPKLYEKVLRKAASWGTPENTMFVIGATKPEQLAEIRKEYPEHFFLVPGVGAQGGNLQEVSAAALTKDGGILVNSSRGIIYASTKEDFAQKAGEKAKAIQQEMELELRKKGLIA